MGLHLINQNISIDNNALLFTAKINNFTPISPSDFCNFQNKITESNRYTIENIFNISYVNFENRHIYGQVNYYKMIMVVIGIVMIGLMIKNVRKNG